ncbi:MAG: cobalamin biosynthesis protein CobQ [Pseudomonadota bacterium]
MNTPAHLILGLAAFGRPSDAKVTVAAGFGALMPDLSLYLLVAGALAMGETPERIFRELYFSNTWQAIFAVDNSVFVYGAIVAVGLLLRRRWLLAFGGAALLHVALDLPLHHDDGRPHFWPVSDWVYESPISYWDMSHGAAWVAPLESALCLALGGWLLWRFRSWLMRAAIALLLVAQLAVGGVWAVVFA